ncbi:MAG: hypothetical protein KY457_11870 [Actinobacteria bacterium]|nr:hypothetical protein [Actinomycetota bacterium]
MELWQLALGANVVVTLAYAAIATRVFRAVHASGQWRTNPLAVATGTIFLTCAAGHAGHVEHMLVPHTASAARAVWDWHFVLIDVVTAGVGLRYWMLRSRFGSLIRGASLFEDVAVRRQEAFDIQDGVVQQLATAKMAFELGDQAAGLRALEVGLDASRRLVHDRSSAASPAPRAGTARPGELRRKVASR